MKRIKVVVPVSSDMWNASVKELMERYKDPDTELQVVNIEKGPESLECTYDEVLADLDIALPKGEFDHVYYRYVVRVNKDLFEIIPYMHDKAVMCARPIFKPLHRYFEMRSGFRNTDEAYSESLSIPIYPTLTQKEQKSVIEALKACLG